MGEAAPCLGTLIVFLQSAQRCKLRDGHLAEWGNDRLSTSWFLRFAQRAPSAKMEWGAGYKLHGLSTRRGKGRLPL